MCVLVIHYMFWSSGKIKGISCIYASLAVKFSRSKFMTKFRDGRRIRNNRSFFSFYYFAVRVIYCRAPNHPVLHNYAIQQCTLFNNINGLFFIFYIVPSVVKINYLLAKCLLYAARWPGQSLNMVFSHCKTPYK